MVENITGAGCCWADPTQIISGARVGTSLGSGTLLMLKILDHHLEAKTCSNMVKCGGKFLYEFYEKFSISSG